MLMRQRYYLDQSEKNYKHDNQNCYTWDAVMYAGVQVCVQVVLSICVCRLRCRTVQV